MTREQITQSVKDAYEAIRADPNLEEVDTLAMMQEAIENAMEYFTGKRPKHVVSRQQFEAYQQAKGVGR